MRKGFRLFFIGLMVLGLSYGVVLAAPNIDPFSPPSDPSSEVGDAQSFNVTVNETCDIMWYMNGSSMRIALNQTNDTYTNNTANAGVYNVTAFVNNSNGTDQHVWTWTVSYSTPVVSLSSPSSPYSNFVGQSTTFTATVDQVANVTWILDGTPVSSKSSTQTASYYNASAQLGTYNLTAFAENANGTDQKEWAWNVSTASVPAITPDPSGSTVLDNTGDSRTFTADIDQTVNVTWLLDGLDIFNETSVMTSSYANTSAQPGVYNLTVLADNANGTNQYVWTWNVTNVSLSITGSNPSSDPETIASDSQEFNVTTNQDCTVNWYLNGTPVQPNSTMSSVFSYTNTTASVGSYNVTAVASNVNGTVQNEWTWDVHSNTYYSGNRIWDANEDMSLDYTWDGRSYSGFHYDLESGMTSENMTIHLDHNSDRNINDGDLVYSTEPIETDFEYDDWGSYQVIGFMAQKYFAGYNAKTIDVSDGKTISLMSDGQLCEVLIDDDEDSYDGQTSIYAGSALILEEGYALNIVQLDVNGDKVFVTLTKDGSEVDATILSSDSTYVYEKDLGSVDDVPIIAVHFDEIFSGTETSAVFVDGIFQISDEYTEVEDGDNYGVMEVDNVNANKIEMSNDDSIDLDEGDIITIMGKLKFVVADDPSTLRFAPFVDMSDPGTYELRGTIAEDESLTWTPLNFEGFYYDIDEGIMSESLAFTYDGDDTINVGNLVYTATPVTNDFEYDAWNSYQVIGFMAEKYFAGYTNSNGWDDNIDLISGGQLSKVLIDSGEDTSIYSGQSLILEEGYALNIVEVDQDGSKVFVELTKDGDKIESGIISTNDNFVYDIDLGDEDDVPIIVVHFNEIFRGTETNAVFVEGIFQISDEYTEVEDGDNYGEMEVTSTSGGITMKNDDTIELDEGETIEIMGEIMFKVADDSSNVRYYPFVEVETAPDESLDLDFDTTITEGDSLTISVTSRGMSVGDVTVKSEGETVGTTSDAGTVTYTPDDAGIFTITAEKEGYTSGEGELEVISPDDEERKISIEVSPEEVYEGNSIAITVVKSIGGDLIEGADVTFDGTPLGTTSGDGTLTYTVTEPGMHKLVATAEGYLDTELNFEVMAMEAEFQFSDLVISPLEVKTGKDVTITLDALNIGNAEGSYNVDLLINDHVTDSEQITLGVNNSTTVQFTHTAGEPGTYLVKVSGMTGTVVVVEGLGIVLYILGGAGLLAAGGAAYLFTAGGWTVDTAGARIGEMLDAAKELISSIKK
ncbi:MAG: S-layer protein domain-containing protein [Euryarchaeota archaeon]|nr:S-layer protein domain-containing protein [Euryarchaeota archaeon]